MEKVTKTFLLTVLVLTVLVTYGAFGQAEQLYYDGTVHNYTAAPISLKVDGKLVSTSMPPIVFGESTLVPAREVFEVLGASVDWYDTQKIVKVSGNNINISLKIDSNDALVNGGNKSMDVPAKLVNDKTMIPVRFVSEQLGFIVNWSDSNRVIDILTQKNDSDIQPQPDGNSTQTQSDSKIIDISFIDPTQNSDVSQLSTQSRMVHVDIKGDRPLGNYTTMTLTGPDRLVIDIDNSELAVSNKTLSVNKYDIDQIRTAQFTTNPNITRVVVDMQKALPYSITKSQDNTQLIINFTVNGSYISTVVTQPTTKDQYIVVLDPGHGGSDPGAVYNGMNEKDINLDIALRLKKLLLADNIDVRLTREDNTYVDLYARTDYANSIDADMFVSIHNNAMEDQNFDGTMTLFDPNDDDGGFTNRQFAQIIQNEMLSQVGTTDRSIRERPNLAVLRTSEEYKIPAVLVEVAFMTNKKDADNLKTDVFQEKVAKALRDGILKSLDKMKNLNA